MVPVARRNLLAEKGRLAVSVAGVAFAILLIMIVLALYRGWSRSGGTIEAIPGDIWVVQQGTLDPFHSVSLIETTRLARIARLPGVAAFTPVLARRMTFEVEGKEASALFMAFDVQAETALVPSARERFLPPEGEMVIDGILHQKTGLDEGDTVSLAGQELRVGKVTGRGSEALTQFVFVNFADAQRIFAVAGTVNYAVITLAPGADARAIMTGVSLADPLLGAFTRRGFAESIRKEIDESFLPIIAILTVIGFVVGAAVVGLMVYTATIERSREFGVLKAVGASGGYLYRIVFTQSVTLTAMGFLVGSAAALGVARVATRAVPDFATEFRWADAGAVLVAAALMALTASFVPVRRINRVDPAQVFRA